MSKNQRLLYRIPRHLPGPLGFVARERWNGLIRQVTYHIPHECPSKPKEIRLQSAWLLRGN
jgi:hypothetical protein